MNNSLPLDKIINIQNTDENIIYFSLKDKNDSPQTGGRAFTALTSIRTVLKDNKQIKFDEDLNQVNICDIANAIYTRYETRYQESWWRRLVDVFTCCWGGDTELKRIEAIRDDILLAASLRQPFVPPGSENPFNFQPIKSDLIKENNQATIPQAPQEYLNILEKLEKLRSTEQTEEKRKEISTLIDAIININDLTPAEIRLKGKDFISIINTIRHPIWKSHKENVANGKGKDEDRETLDKLNLLNLKFGQRRCTGRLQEHRLMIKKSEEIKKFDSTIFPDNDLSLLKGEKTIPFTIGSKICWDNLPGYNSESKEIKVDFEQLPSLSQVHSQNFLCGYYALFFLIQSINNKPVADRESFNNEFNKWISFKVKDYLLSSITNTEVISWGWTLEAAHTALSPSKICQFVKEFKLLENNDNWFVIDEFFDAAEFNEQPHRENFKRKLNEAEVSQEMNIYPEERRGSKSNFPLFIIKLIDSHYYFVKVEKNEKQQLQFTIVHSLNYSIKTEWDHAKWKDLLNSIAFLTDPETRVEV